MIFLVQLQIHSLPKAKPTTLFLNFSDGPSVKKISPFSSAKHRCTHLLVNKMFNVLVSAWIAPGKSWLLTLLRWKGLVKYEQY